MQISQLVPYSLGIAAENKPLTTRHLNITPTELLPALDGEINFNPTTETFSGVDSVGDPYEVSVNKDVSISAEWLPMGSNRVTPPDVRRGEPIMIYRLADSDRYYWQCMGLRDDLRRLETVILAINANPDPSSGRGIDVSECYFLEVSSHQKLITLGTSKANGEPFSYTMQLNTGSGEFTVEDDIGNHLYLNSGRAFWEMTNADGSYYQLDRQTINISAPTVINMEAGSSIILQAGDGIHMSAPSISSKSDVTEHNCPTTTYSGHLSIGGNLSVGGAGGGGGDVHIRGSGLFEGSLEFTETLSAQRIECTYLNASQGVSAPNL